MNPGVVDLAVEPTSIPGLSRVRVKQVADERGVVREFFRLSAFHALGAAVPGGWPQLNVTTSGHGVIRGIHAEAIDKYVMVGAGTIYAVIVDLRPGSSTAGAAQAFDLGPGDGLVVSAGLGNSFQTTSPGGSTYLYWFSGEWQPGMVGSAATPLDPALAAQGIRWPVPIDPANRSLISEKDAKAPLIAEVVATDGGRGQRQ